MKMIRSLKDLVEHFGATDPSKLNRRLYKDTSCGASISIQRPNGQWLHNGTVYDLAKWNKVRKIRAFTIQTIVEGSDATVDSPLFALPVKAAEVDQWIEDMEAEATILWNEANSEEPEDA